MFFVVLCFDFWMMYIFLFYSQKIITSFIYEKLLYSSFCLDYLCQTLILGQSHVKYSNYYRVRHLDTSRLVWVVKIETDWHCVSCTTMTWSVDVLSSTWLKTRWNVWLTWLFWCHPYWLYSYSFPLSFNLF